MGELCFRSLRLSHVIGKIRQDALIVSAATCVGCASSVHVCLTFMIGVVMSSAWAGRCVYGSVVGPGAMPTWVDGMGRIVWWLGRRVVAATTQVRLLVQSLLSSAQSDISVCVCSARLPNTACPPERWVGARLCQ